ncbi:hypothetical protein FJY93_04355 [Candidatus Kaiserbacteria bacterium]|nr:hypothetical protein [Candidatus Kaiserbacteria bacterium]
MSWAFRRRLLYISGIVFFFLILFGTPIAYKILSVPATCFDGLLNQGETSTDKGGPCLLLDERYLQPYGILWARGFRVRDGTYNAVAYVQNTNEGAGVERVGYRVKLYDADNVLVAERLGTMYIMPGSITPVLESRIDTGFRNVSRTYFEFTEPLVWKRMKNRSTSVVISDKNTLDPFGAPQVTATAHNVSVGTLNKVLFVAAVFDPQGNAIQTSATTIDVFPPETAKDLIFTWPDPFSSDVGRVEILPIVPPVLAPLPAKK